MVQKENTSLEHQLKILKNFMMKIPSINTIHYSIDESGNWYVKFTIDITNTLSWNVVQELGHICNSISLQERLPTIFYPVSPPPYMNGGPQEFLSWIIESKDTSFGPEMLLEWLQGRLPQPVNDTSKWENE